MDRENLRFQVSASSNRSRLLLWSMLVFSPVYLAVSAVFPDSDIEFILTGAFWVLLALYLQPMRSLETLPFDPPRWWSRRDRAIVLGVMRAAPVMAGVSAIIFIIISVLNIIL